MISSIASAGESGTVGSVDFAFDGGTIKCEFGTKDRSSKPSVAIIVHPATVKSAAGRKNLFFTPGTKGSVVMVIDAEGKHQQLDQKAVTRWAKQRVAEMTERTSLAENAFVAAAVHTVTTGEPIRVWSADAVDLLRSGHWAGLFRTAPDHQDPFEERDPFAEGDPFAAGDPFPDRADRDR